jgi:ketosteroid isomerase-like protein
MTQIDMTQTPNDSPALKVWQAHFDAWTSKSMDEAMIYIADDIVCDAPAGKLEGAAAYRNFLEPFSGILTGVRLIATFGDETTAVGMYEAATFPVPEAPGAECVTVSDGKITHSRFIFDRAPFDAARAAAKAAGG